VRITISGASGLIGRRLLKLLTTEGHSVGVLSRHAGVNMPGGVRVWVWDPMKGEPPAESLSGADAIVHLAGEPVAQRWTEESKQRIRDSRVAGTRNLVQALAKLPQRPEALICASAVGYYGSRGDEILEESSAPGKDFLAEVSVAWEQEAEAAESLGIRVVQVRTGVVLDTRGGALKHMLPPFKMGVGGKLSSGRQWMSWIHHEDLAGIYRFALSNQVRGPVNGVAPQPVSNAQFTRELGQALKRPTLFPVPGIVLKLLFGDMAQILLGSQRALPMRAEAAGYRFHYPKLAPALTDVLRG